VALLGAPTGPDEIRLWATGDGDTSDRANNTADGIALERWREAGGRDYQEDTTMRQPMTKGAALSCLMLLLTVLLGAVTPALAAERPENGSLTRQETTERADSAPNDVQRGEPTAAPAADDPAGAATGPEAAKKDGRRNHDKKRHHRPPTCFGQRATIADHHGIIQGTSGDDVIIGDRSNNFVLSNGGVDRICGGPGDDLLRSFDPGQIFVDGGSGVDNIQASTGDDVLRGGDGNDILNGLEGNDRLEGGNGDDLINAQAGDDELLGGEGDDKLDGDLGSDALDGGPGADLCRQDPFPDAFVAC